MAERPIRIPKDPEARARLAQMAGLTDEERLAIDQWCEQQQVEYEARLRRAIEEVGDTPMGRFPKNEQGHACRRDAIVDGICIDCERPPKADHFGSSTSAPIDGSGTPEAEQGEDR